MDRNRFDRGWSRLCAVVRVRKALAVYVLEVLIAVGLFVGVVWVLDLNPLRPYVMYCFGALLFVHLFQMDRSRKPWRLRLRWHVQRDADLTTQAENRRHDQGR